MKIFLWLGVTTTRGTVSRGGSIRKAENPWSRESEPIEHAYLQRESIRLAYNRVRVVQQWLSACQRLWELDSYSAPTAGCLGSPKWV